MHALAERRLWLLAILILAGIVSGCATMRPPNLVKQIQASQDVKMVWSDGTIIQVLGENIAQYTGNQEVSNLFLYSSQVTLAALSIAMAAATREQTVKSLGYAQSGWLALLGIFRPDEHATIYAQGVINLNNALTEYVLCQYNSGSNTVPQDVFTGCGATLFLRVGSSTNLVIAQKAKIQPQVGDVENVQPLRIEGVPKSLTLPRSAVGVP